MREEQFNILQKEYEHILTSLDRREDKIIQILTIGTGLASAATVAIATNQVTLVSELAWLVPLVFIIFYCSAIYLFFFQMSEIWLARILADRINTILGEVILIHNARNSLESRFFSTSSGNVKHRFLLIIVVAVNIAFYFAILYVSWRVIYKQNHFEGFLFVLIYVLLVIMLIVVLTGVFVDLPTLYRSFEKKSRELQSFPIALITSHRVGLASHF